MRRFLAPALALAVALSGCGKKSESTGGGAASPPPGSQSQPADPIDPTKIGNVKGVVKLDGWVKGDVPEVRVNSIPYCAAQHPGGPPLTETLVLGDGQTMGNVLVYVKSGVGNRRFDPPANPVTLDQVGCIYKPHVVALQTRQPLKVHNSDSTLHNVNGKPKLNEAFNRGQVTKGSEDTFQFPNPEIGISVQCDVHPWMKAILHVVAHPYFQVTGKDGAYTLTGLPAGEYEIHAWHEKFDKPVIEKVKVEAGKDTTQNFTFKGGTKP